MPPEKLLTRDDEVLLKKYLYSTKVHSSSQQTPIFDNPYWRSTWCCFLVSVRNITNEFIGSRFNFRMLHYSFTQHNNPVSKQVLSFTIYRSNKPCYYSNPCHHGNTLGTIATNLVTILTPLVTIVTPLVTIVTPLVTILTPLVTIVTPLVTIVTHPQRTTLP